MTGPKQFVLMVTLPISTAHWDVDLLGGECLPRQTLYQILGVEFDASPATIAAAYNAIAQDIKAWAGRDPEGAAIYAIAVEEAYRTLSASELRKDYDARIDLAGD